MTLCTRVGLENFFVIEQADGKHQGVVRELENQLYAAVNMEAVRDWRFVAAPGVHV
jgi:hypothetical protein